MKRRHLFEWEDQPWLPRRLRADLTALLRYHGGALYRPVVPLLRHWLLRNRCGRVVDLCSGAGGPWPALLPLLRAEGPDVQLLLTDKFPPPRPSAPDTPALRYHPHPVDALAVPGGLGGCRTLFTGFHHFAPAEARRLLQQAAEAQAPLAVFEFTERTWSNMLGMLLSPLVVWAHVPRLRPFRWRRLLWTYLVPLLPLLYLWDGLVSHLRTYTVAELQAMTAALPAGDYRWQIGQIDAEEAGVTITYVLGEPA